jgi:hypothetical protein
MVLEIQIGYVFMQKSKLPIPKPAQLRPLWIQEPRIVMSIPNMQSSLSYLFDVLAECLW